MIATKEKIWLSSPHMSGDEEHYIKEAFRTNWIAPLGPNVNGFEHAIANFYNHSVKPAVLSSGTASIHLAFKVLGVGRGDLVLCQSMTFAASANPITYLGANPIFIDSERETWNACPELLERAILDAMDKGRKPKAIMAVHLYGMPYNVAAIASISQKYGIPVIEDSAEALGSTYLGIPCGSLADIGILSFNGNKIITTSGGGALLSKSQAVRDQVVFLATQARDEAPHYEHSQIGYNYRMSNVLAGIGIAQMDVLPERVEARRRNFEYYKCQLSDLPGLEFLSEPEGMKSNRWLTTLLFRSFEEREKVRLALLEENIESRPLWKPMHLQKVFRNELKYENGISEDLFSRGLCLPSGSDLRDVDLMRIVDLIKKNLER
ncbi:DegT/DnrJ/EryC1/StrS family aminotransferase [Robertkochia aurantiaca]|uniref:DegT/DnrJ/EryC1/StrS family aminotransferase n=1 Tax=Robertkochia aurantiaca TaxID=2873700 RepID=UPI001CCBFABB|nr:DegT/DnrJ/EryC1/StrS family aminotransferase [Robertkochia sp. 3YJGBD-33]